MQYSSIDINYRILSQNHPFYIYGYCKNLPDFCNELGYELLQIWVWPSLSTNQIAEMLPEIDYEDVISLALIYTPIPESVKYYDSLHLLYYACMKNVDDIKPFLSNISSTHGLLIGNIALKFNRRDIIDLLMARSDINNITYDNLTYISKMIDIKNGNRNIQKPNKLFILQDLILPIRMWSWVELAENIILLSILQPNYGPLSSLFGLLAINAPAIMNSPNYREAADIARNIDNSKDTINQLMNKHGKIIPNTLQRLDNTNNIPPSESKFLDAYIASLEVSSDNISDSNLGKFYIESSDYTSFINWRNAGNQLNIDDVVEINDSPLGVASHNLEYISVYGGKLNE